MNETGITPRLVGLVGAILVVALLAANSLFTVAQTEQVLLTQLGRPLLVIETPGLHVKIPFVQTAIPFDRRLLDYDTPPEEVILGDQRRLIVDAFARFRIGDPLTYYQAVGPTEQGIRARLDSVLSSSLRSGLGNEQLLDVLSSQRTRIMGAIQQQVNREMADFGVAVLDVRIRRADLPPENTQAVLARMQSERQRVASQVRAQGAEQAAGIRADADRARTVLLAQAHAKAEALRGEGEAAATRIYAQAYSQNPHFFAIWRSLEAYRQGFAAGKARLVLSPDSGFLALLKTLPQPEKAPPSPPGAR
jgi:membrane protease subunit HflC